MSHQNEVSNSAAVDKIAREISRQIFDRTIVPLADAYGVMPDVLLENAGKQLRGEAVDPLPEPDPEKMAVYEANLAHLRKGGEYRIEPASQK